MTCSAGEATPCSLPPPEEDLTDVASRAEVAAGLDEQRRAQRPWLVVVNSASALGKTFGLDRTLLVGRAADCDVRLEERGLSRHHARVERREDGTIVLEDLDSKNGTYVNGNRVSVCELHDGDKVQLGHLAVLRLSYQDGFDEALHKLLYESATRDPLTKLANKAAFVETLDREIAFARRHRSMLALVLFDVDHFKLVNDTFGHDVGDQVLASLGEMIARCVRIEDVVARVGGEEFAIVLRGLSEAQAAACAERVRTIVEGAEFVEGDRRIPVTISLGVASYSARCSQRELLVRAADRNLYRAKRSGRNRVVSGERASAGSRPERPETGR